MPAKAQTDALKSRAESSNYEETSRYDDVMNFIAALQRQTKLLRVESFGKTEEGRDLPLMIMASPMVATPQAAQASGKAVIFVQANIHAGEVEGKEAMQHIARRIALGDLRPLLDKLVILIAPIYNADGNEKISLNNRTAQNGPIAGVGTRENANRLDLNRDYMKMEAAEARALIGLFNRWDPHLIVDLHTTNGSYHGYHLTYSPMLTPNADARLISFERDKMLPAITEAMQKQHQFRTYYYGNFSTKDALQYEFENFQAPRQEGKEKVWATFDHRPRYGNNYAGVRNRLTILSEAYSYLDFRGRVAVTEAFVEEIYKYSAAHAKEIVALLKRVDKDTVSRKTAELGIEFESKALDQPVEILVGEVVKKQNPRSGKMMTTMIEDKVTPVKMLDYGLFAAKRNVAVPRAYLLRNEPGMKTIIEKLKLHGIVMEELTKPASIEVESFMIDKFTRATRVFQGHREISIKGHAQSEKVDFPAGTLVIQTAQPLAKLAFHLLEAESGDGFVAWNFLDDYLGDGKVYPIYKLTKNTKLVGKVAR
ncbi:MAG: M14 family metallopeptidase [Acidobacteria bacterium]|nr:M14 family metallopeptidase [Acidobacteriota bacterium]